MDFTDFFEKGFNLAKGICGRGKSNRVARVEGDNFTIIDIEGMDSNNLTTHLIKRLHVGGLRNI